MSSAIEKKGRIPRGLAKEIAEAVGCSIPYVSLVLHGKVEVNSKKSSDIVAKALELKERNAQMNEEVKSIL